MTMHDEKILAHHGNRGIRVLRSVLLGVVCLVCFAIGFVADSHAQNRLATAERYLYALYPELQGQGYTIQVIPVYPVDPAYILDVGSKQTKRLLSANVYLFSLVVREQPKGKGPFHDEFDDADRMNPPVGPMLAAVLFRPSDSREDLFSQVAASGRVVSSDQWERLKDLVDDHPEWSRDEALRALKDAGVRFGPDAKEEFLRGLPLNRLERLWSGKISIRSAEFRVREPLVAGADHPPAAKVEWTVEITVQRPARPAVGYTLLCEPLGGRIVDMLGGGSLRDYERRLEQDIKKYGRDAVLPPPS
jgi:hypothetical protein